MSSVLLFSPPSSLADSLTSFYTPFVFAASLDGALPNGPGFYYTSCTIKLESCFGSFWTESETTPAVDAFKRLAFEKTECGDCSE